MLLIAAVMLLVERAAATSLIYDYPTQVLHAPRDVSHLRIGDNLVGDNTAINFHVEGCSCAKVKPSIREKTRPVDIPGNFSRCSGFTRLIGGRDGFRSAEYISVCDGRTLASFRFFYYSSAMVMTDSIEVEGMKSCTATTSDEQMNLLLALCINREGYWHLLAFNSSKLVSYARVELTSLDKNAVPAIRVISSDGSDITFPCPRFAMISSKVPSHLAPKSIV